MIISTQIRGALPLTRIRTAPRQANAYTTRQYTVNSRIYPSRLLSSPFNRKYTSTNAGKNGSPSPDKRQTSEDDFKISFRDLGMNRITKFVVYTAICVFGTMETIFWCKAIWRWWTGGEESEE
ncbi:hypothetical protein RRF57_006543 [Xylaria bambusicola]|uniref:Uncharacterized protein n=1 Tax=Xylaria bambusicola TaxID=326684 RepID=A0AAN7UQH5_9PEZI